MARYIDADALHELIDGGYDLDFDEVPETKRELLRMIEQQETIDAVPREELFDLFTEITAAEYGKQRFFMQTDGTVYDRHKGDYLHNFDLAVVRFCNELSDW